MADQNGEAVTFLFTDIEGSTARWEALPDAMQVAVARHDDLVRTAIVGNSGRVFKATGDGFNAVFVEPLAAVRAALAIQRAVQAHRWGAVGPLRLRVALHLGPAQQRDGDFFGQTLNRVARLVQAAEGGEILLSGGIAEAARGDLPPGTTLISLGDLRLRDLREPIRVYRLSGPSEETVQVAALQRPAAPPETPTVSLEALASAAEAPASPPSGLVVADTSIADVPAQDGRLRIFVLGGFRIEGSSSTLANDGWSRRKARQLLKCLLTRPSLRLTRDEAYDLFWPDSEVASSNFRVILHALRHALAGVGVARPDELVLSDHDGVAVARHGIWVDADAFEHLAAPLHDATASDDDLEAAARLYGGDFLADDLYEAWAAARRGHLRRIWVDVLLELARRRERRGEIDLAAAALERRLAADPCDDLATIELMRLWVRHGRRTDALRAYQRLADALRVELGVEPGAEATRLRDDIMAGQAAQTGPMPRVVPAPSAEGAASVAPASFLAASSSAPAAPTSAPANLPAAAALLPVPPFEPSYPFPLPTGLVGRQQELLTLGQMLERGRLGGQTVLIGGPAGGKSTLAGAVVRHARTRGFLCLVGGSFEQDSPIPFGSIRDALGDYLLAREPEQVWSELGGMVADLEPIIPELRYHLNLTGGEGGRQFENSQLLSVVHSCLRALATRQPVLLCLEDLHAADSATVAALPYFGRQIRRLPVTVLGTYRTDEMTADHRLARMLPKLVRERMIVDLRLRPLLPDEMAQVAAGLLGGHPDESLMRWLHEMTTGNPFLGEQLLLALRDEGALVQQPGGWRSVPSTASPSASVPSAADPSAGPVPACPKLPLAVRAVLERRAALLDADSREMLDVAAMLGQSFDLADLAAVLGLDSAATVLRLETLLDAHLIRECDSGYRFEQPLLRESLCQGLPGHRRAALEARAHQVRDGLALQIRTNGTSLNGRHPHVAIPVSGSSDS